MQSQVVPMWSIEAAIQSYYDCQEENQSGVIDQESDEELTFSEGDPWIFEFEERVLMTVEVVWIEHFESEIPMEILDCIWEFGIVDEIKDEPANTALHLACYEGNASVIPELIKAGACVNARNSCGYTALDYGCQEGHAHIIPELVSAGADVNAKGKHDNTALHLGCVKGHVSVISYLIDAGADVNARNRDGYTSLHYGCEKGHACVIPALVRFGADVNAKDIYGMTALQRGCEKGHECVILELIEAGADMNVKNHGGETALDFAVPWGGCEQILIDTGCDVSENLHVSSVKTALGFNASRRASAQEALKDIGFYNFTEIHELLDFLFLPCPE